MSIFDREKEWHSEDEAIARGQHAHRLLQDPLLIEAYEEAEWELVKLMAHQATTPAQREVCFAALQGMGEIFKALRVIVGDGQFAAAEHD